jgi:arylsulfatase A
MIVNGPGLVRAGVVSDELVDLSDVLPTLAELARTRLPQGVTIDGHSFAPILQGQKGPTREWIFSYLGYRRMLRDKRWLLEGDGRFYDCGHDRDGTGYKDVTDSTDREVIAARQRFEAILTLLHAPAKPAGPKKSQPSPK